LGWKQLIRVTSTREKLEELLLAARQQERDSALAARRERSTRWHAWVAAQTATGSKRVFRWLRAGSDKEQAAATPPAVEGPAAALRNAGLRWLPLWEAPGPFALPERWSPLLAGILPCPRLEPISAKELEKLVAKIPGGKAAGFDGIVGNDIKNLPPLFYVKLSEFLNEVEGTGVWPEALSTTVVVLIPKAGATDPDERRPIALLSLLYRLWARYRARSVSQWASAFDPQPVGARAGALEKARDLAVAVEVAAASDQVLSGIALDWAKCYDRISLALVAKTLRAAGWPTQCWRLCFPLTCSPGD
jgi:hypothetical protein